MLITAPLAARLANLLGITRLERILREEGYPEHDIHQLLINAEEWNEAHHRIVTEEAFAEAAEVDRAIAQLAANDRALLTSLPTGKELRHDLEALGVTPARAANAARRLDGGRRGARTPWS